MAALNGGLGVRLGSPMVAVCILFAVGFAASIIVLFVTEGLPSILNTASAPWYFYLGGLFVVFYILSITWVAPRFGVANAVSFVLFGQLIAMTVIDQFGFAGAPQYEITLQRVVGLLLMATGVFMTVLRSHNP